MTAFNLLGLDLLAMLAVSSIILGAYVIFSVVGFGTALIAAPMLVYFLPLTTVLPLLALLDFIGAARRGISLSAEVAFDEIKWMVPMMVVGSALGIIILFAVDESLASAWLGLFIVMYVIYSSLLIGADRKFSKLLAAPFGFFGGILGGLFGSGGFLYALYLGRRLECVSSVRATMGVVIAISTTIRIALFSIAGAYFDIEFLFLALIVAPLVFLGEIVGDSISSIISKQMFVVFLRLMMIASGVALLGKHILTS